MFRCRNWRKIFWISSTEARRLLLNPFGGYIRFWFIPFTSLHFFKQYYRYYEVVVEFECLCRCRCLCLCRCNCLCLCLCLCLCRCPCLCRCLCLHRCFCLCLSLVWNGTTSFQNGFIDEPIGVVIIDVLSNDVLLIKI